MVTTVKRTWAWFKRNGSAALAFYLHFVILIEFGCSFRWLLIWLSPGHTLTEESVRADWLNCFSAFSLSSRKNSAVAKKNMPPRTMIKGQSMRA